MKVKAVYFDMDGVLCDLYGVHNWRNLITRGDVTPYVKAGSLVNPGELYKVVTALQERGLHVGVLTWGAKGSNKRFLKETKQAKLAWLARTYRVVWNSVKVMPYGMDKSKYAMADSVLIDDSPINRARWNGLCAIDGGKQDMLTQLLALTLGTC